VKRALALLVVLALAPAGTAAVHEGPSDPLYEAQYGVEMIEAPAAWDEATGEGVRVAVVDGGIDLAHHDLVANTATTDGDSTAEPYGVFSSFPTGPWDTTQDTDGHGTRVAGILAAGTDNALGIAGASEATVIPYKVDGVGVIATADGLAAAIDAAVDDDVDVIQVSYTVPSSTEELDAALARAEAASIPVVAAAGNTDEEAPAWPARAGTVVAVGAVDAEAEAWSPGNDGPDLAAPGVDVLTTDVGNAYTEATGTSMAAPFVSGTAALALDACPSLTPAELRAGLNASARDLRAEGYDDGTGWGLVQADAALASIQADCE
jgi:subtilisin family serine protease